MIIIWADAAPFSHPTGHVRAWLRDARQPNNNRRRYARLFSALPAVRVWTTSHFGGIRLGGTSANGGGSVRSRFRPYTSSSTHTGTWSLASVQSRAFFRIVCDTSASFRSFETQA